MSDAVLRIDQVGKSFGAVRAVKSVTLEVARGDFFALLGPSGSGKTTLLRIIAGLETPDRGTVEIGGRDVTRMPPYGRHLGMVFQDFLLFPHKTVRDNISFPLKMQGFTAAQKKEQLDWVLDFVRLIGYEDRYPHQLSGGEKQRVALARGLVARPEILLLDEPLANLDRELRKEMEVEVRRYQVELGIPFIYVTHNQEEALTMSDRMAVMHGGRFEQVGPKLRVYERPATRFVASFVGAANRLAGRLERADGATARLDWQGLGVTVLCPANAKAGDAVEYFIKSERIAIDSPGAGQDENAGLNRLVGTLRDVIFKGQYADYFVILANGAELMVSGSPGLPDISPHAPVELSWAPDAGDAFLVEAS